MNMPATTTNTSASPLRPPGFSGSSHKNARPQRSTFRNVPPKQMFLLSSSSLARFVLLVVVALLLPLPVVALGSGGEKAFFTTPQMTPDVSHRQNMCERFNLFRNGTVQLQDTLEGMQLHVLMGAYQGSYFNYNEETGINPEDPGLAAILMDELARRAKFTWRDSFGVFYDPTDESWTDLLVWGTAAYDVNVDWWAKNIDRMNLGVAFLKEWYDSSIILISQQETEQISDDITFWNWLRPYEHPVWLVTVATIIVSGLVHQFIEYLSNERDNRTFWEWWSENFYLSMINFTQAYEYGTPRSFAAKIFGISMAVWALVMTATYTANLASLLVDRKGPDIYIESIEEAAVFGRPICTVSGTNADTFIRDNYPSAIRVEKVTIEEVYRGLRRGECLFAAETKASWLQRKSVREYNPKCNLEWVGGDRIVREVTAGFATNSDSGFYCTSLIRDVINLHMERIIADGFLDLAWEREYKRSQTIDCNSYRPELVAELTEDDDDETRRRRRQLLSRKTEMQRKHLYTDYHHRREDEYRRHLKAGGKAAAAGAVAASEEGGDAERLTLEQMVGSFAFHWIMMFVAVAWAVGNRFWLERQKRQAQRAQGKESEEEPTMRSYGAKSTAPLSVNSNNSEGGELTERGEEVVHAIKSLQRQMEEMILAQATSQAAFAKFQTEIWEEQRKLVRQVSLPQTSPR